MTISNSMFTGNTAQNSGGALLNWDNGSVNMTNCTITDNSAGAGGGIANWQGTVTISGTTISDNSASGGGGIYNQATLTDNGGTLSSNSAPAGAAIFTQGGSLTLNAGTIQAPPTFTGSNIEIQGGASVIMSGVTVDSAATSTAIEVNASSLTATGIGITGYLIGISVVNNGSATITDSTLSSDATGILVGSGASDTCTVTATNDSFASDTTGVQNNQTGGPLNATLDWWGSVTGPANATNPGGTGAAAAGNVSFSPWLGDASIVAPDYLVFLSTTGNQYAVTPNSGNSSLQVTLGGSPVGSISGGDTLGFTGSGGTVTINGETGASSLDVFNINDTSVKFAAADGLSGSTISFVGTAITRNVDAQGTTNTFNILGAGASGPSGSLVGDVGTNAFVFSGSSKLIGSIQGAGSSTLDFSAYGSGVTVKLANGTATGVSGTVAGITAVIGSAFNDTLKAGTVPGVALTGGLGINTLSGTGAGDSVVESISSNYTLVNGSLTGTGSASFTDNLTGIKVATLSGASATGNTFTVSGWTGSGSLTAPAGTGTVAASKSNNFTLSNTSLSSGDGMSLTLSGIVTANLTIAATGHTFTETGWIGNGSLTGTSSTVAASNPSGFTITPTSLTSGPMSLSLAGITTANLTDSSGGGNTFVINGWTGSGKLSGTGETVAESVSTAVTLADNSLAVTGIPALTMSGFTAANLTDTAGGNVFTVSGWKGSGSLDDTGSTPDTVAASKAASYTLASNALTSTDGMTLGLTGFATANLTTTGGGQTFTETGWTGSGSLTATSGTVAASNPSGFTLTPTSLTAGPMALSLSGINTANLTDSSSGGKTFNITGWTGKGTLSGASETLVDNVSAKTTLTNTSLAVTGNPTLTLAGFTAANLTDPTGGNTFVVSGWTGGGSLVDIRSNADTVTASKSAGFTLTNGSLSSTDGMNLTLGGITTANLTDSGSGGNTFTVSGWSGTGTLKGTGETLVDSATASVSLANSSLAVTGGATLTLNGFTTANLTDSAGGNTFTVSGWTGGGSLSDTGAGGDTVAASKSAGYTLANSSLASTDGMSLGLSRITTANLTATSAGKTFDVSGWTGSGSLTDTAATGDTVTATKSASMTLTGTSFSSTDGMTLILSNFKTATLTVTASSGNPSYVVDASAFTGVTNLTATGTVDAILLGGSTNGSTLSATGSGDDVLIGGPGKNTLSDTGTGYNILIGGAGVDTLTGNGNDILISGTTSYDSNIPANIAALDAILAEWSSSDSYSTRINKIMTGITVGSSTVALNATTCQSDAVANTLSDGTAPTQNNWFIVNTKDKVTKQAGETATVV